MKRLAALVALASALLVAGAAPASAHTIGGVQATNYRSEITAVTPAVPGLTIRLLDLGRRMELVNTTGDDVVVLGYQNEPYLRVGPGGVFENRRSPSLYQNKLNTANPSALVSLPPEADPNAAPEWHRRSGGDSVTWRDHRARWEGADPPAVRANPGVAQTVVSRWTVAFLKGQDQASIVVTGRIAWVPGPAVLPLFVAVAVLFGLALAAGTVA